MGDTRPRKDSKSDASSLFTGLWGGGVEAEAREGQVAEFGGFVAISNPSNRVPEQLGTG